MLTRARKRALEQQFQCTSDYSHQPTNLRNKGKRQKKSEGKCETKDISLPPSISYASPSRSDNHTSSNCNSSQQLSDGESLESTARSCSIREIYITFLLEVEKLSVELTMLQILWAIFHFGLKSNLPAFFRMSPQQRVSSIKHSMPD